MLIRGVIFGIALIIFQSSSIFGDGICITVTNESHYVSPKDFKPTMNTEKYVMCAAYYCSSPLDNIQLTINSFNHTVDRISIYVGGATTHTLDGSCGICGENFSNGNLEVECKPCKEIIPAKSFEIHVGLSNIKDYKSKNVCNLISPSTFNMTVKDVPNEEKLCNFGLLISIPKDDCTVSPSSVRTNSCIMPTSEKRVIGNQDLFLGYKNIFVQNSTGETSIWEIDTSLYKNISITFSPIIQKNLLLYESDFLHPKFNFQNCPIIGKKNISTNVDKLIIVYKNPHSLAMEEFLGIKFLNDRCIVPNVSNSQVELQQMESGQILALYQCFQGYRLVGFTQILCQEDGWQEEPPVCEFTFENLPSDEPDREIADNHFYTETTSGEAAATKNKVPKDNVSLSHIGEGSGNWYGEESLDYDGEETEDYEVKSPNINTDDARPTSNNNSEYLNNTNLFRNVSIIYPTWPNGSTKDLVFFKFPSFQDNMITFIAIGTVAGLVILVSVLFIIICHCKKSAENRRKRTFDHHQNPIYEKPVAPLTVRDSDDEGMEKLDLGYLSDSTALD